MSSFDINVNEIKKGSLELHSEKGKLMVMSNEIGTIDLTGVLGNYQMAMIQEALETVKHQTKENEKSLAAISESLADISYRYTSTDSQIMTHSGVKVDSIGTILGTLLGTKMAGKGYDISSEVTEVIDISDEGFLNKSTKKIAKNILTKTMKELKPGSEKIVDIGEIVVKLENGDVFGALEKVPGLNDIKAWDFKKLNDLAKDSKDRSGIMNAGVLKFQAAMKVLKEVTDSDGYIQNYQRQYEVEAQQYLRQGNILGTIYSLSSEFVQTVGKGTVDVTCQLISGGLDSAIKTASLGFLDLSTINATMEDMVGGSLGTLFNATTQGISSGVDFIVDDLIPGVAGAAVDVAGKAIDAGGELISSGIDFIKNLF